MGSILVNKFRHEDYEYVREGAADIYMVVAPLAQRREVFVADNHSGNTWAKIVAYIVEQMFPQSEKITLIEDNLSTHKRYNLYNVFEPQRARAILNKLEFVYTPKHGSWLNIAECELSVLSRQALDARFENKEKLETQVKIWAQDRNNAQKGVDWQFKTADARIKLKKRYPSVLI